MYSLSSSTSNPFIGGYFSRIEYFITFSSAAIIKVVLSTDKNSLITSNISIIRSGRHLSKSSITINWNQSTNKLLVKLPSLQASQSTILTIHDIQGRLVARNKISQLSNEIAVPEFTGIAIITILNDNKIWESKKVLIMK